MAQLDLHKVATRETSGASTSSRFRFQANLAVLWACDLHQQPGDYAVIVEHFEDITLYQPENDKPLTFIQVKGKASGSWTIDSLTKCDPKKPAPNSIVGKLYSNVPFFAEFTAGLQFVTNAAFNVKLSSGSKCPSDANEIMATTLHQIELTKIANSLDADHPAPRIPDCKDLLTLRRVSLDIKDQDTFVIGRLVKLTDALGLSGVAHSALYKTLHSDVSAKSSSVLVATSTADIIEKKAITRNDFQALLKASTQTPRFQDFLPLLKSDLLSEGMPAIQVLKLIASCRSFIAERSLGRPTENLVSERMQRVFAENSHLLQSCSSIFEMAEYLVDSFGETEISEDILRAGAFIAISETIDG